MVVPVVVARPANIMLEKVAEPKRFAKLLKKGEPAKAGQACGADGEMDGY